MQIDWLAFTPGPSLLGGVLLGIAVVLFIFLHGRILGISSIVSGLLHTKEGDWSWRLALVLGIVSAPFWATFLFGMHSLQIIDANWIVLIFAGLLVGFGVQYGSGCTSGHGICGLSRLSPRSLIATLTFIGSGLITVYFIRHVLGFIS